jgi:hypothetical protein
MNIEKVGMEYQPNIIHPLRSPPHDMGPVMEIPVIFRVIAGKIIEENGGFSSHV